MIPLKRILLLMFYILLGFSASSLQAQESSKQAEKIVEQYYQAFYRQQWKEAAEMMHPEALAKLQRMFAHMAETIPDLKERKEFLRLMGGVNTIAAFRKADPKTIFVQMFQSALRMASKEYREMWKTCRIKVIGSVPEDDLIHVVSRTSATVENNAGSVISVASAKQSEGKWKVYTSMEFDRIVQKIGGK